MKYVEKSVSDNSSCSRRNIKLEMKSESITNITHTSQRNHKYKNEPPVKHISFEELKVYPCSNPDNHVQECCVYYHGEADRRRPGNSYCEMLCPSIQQGMPCNEADRCEYSHSLTQQLYRYDKYKTQFCSHYPSNTTQCKYRELCPHAHSESQISIPLIHHYEFDDDFYMFYYKTIMCPFSKQHSSQQCVYAHTIHDFRRSPHHYNYDPLPCPSMDDLNSPNSNSQCVNGSMCGLAHGALELQYHPLRLGTVKCKTRDCGRLECPYFHTEEDRRRVGPELMSKVFNIVPRNRLVEGTYKNDFNTGFKAKKLTPPSSISKDSKPKDNTVILLKHSPPQLDPEDRRFKTAMNPKRKTIVQPEIISPVKWIKESQMCESDDDEEVIANAVWS